MVFVWTANSCFIPVPIFPDDSRNTINLITNWRYFSSIDGGCARPLFVNVYVVFLIFYGTHDVDWQFEFCWLRIFFKVYSVETHFLRKIGDFFLLWQLVKSCLFLFYLKHVQHKVQSACLFTMQVKQIRLNLYKDRIHWLVIEPTNGYRRSALLKNCII